MFTALLESAEVLGDNISYLLVDSAIVSAKRLDETFGKPQWQQINSSGALERAF